MERLPLKPDEAPSPASAGAAGSFDFLLAVWFGFVLILNFPGHLSLDALVQISEGKSGVFESWNPQFISIVFGRLAEAAKTPAILMLISAALLGLSLRSIVMAAGPLRGSGLLLSGGMLFAPILLIYPAIIWKDVWFGHASLAAFAIAVHLHEHARPSGWRSTGLRMAALALMAFGVLSRQTAILVAAVACVGLAAASPWVTRFSDSRKLAVNAMINLAILMVLSSTMHLSSQALVTRAAGAPVQTGLKLIMTYDMAGILHRVPDANLSRFDAAGVDSPPIRQAALRTYRADRIDTLEWPQSHEFAHLAPGELRRQWLDLILENPGAYLRHKLSAYSWLVGLEDQSRCTPIFLGFGAPELVQAAGIRQQPTTHFSDLFRYTKHWIGSPYFSPAAWGLISMCVLFLMIRRGWGHHPIAWMQVASLLFLVSYLPLSIACDFRYTYFSVIAAHAGLLFTVVAWPRIKRGPMPRQTRQHLLQ